MKQLLRTRLLVKAVLLCSNLSPAFAQPPALHQELLKDWMEMKVLNLANEMPEDTLSRPLRRNEISSSRCSTSQMGT
jgi:hypothetical protein